MQNRLTNRREDSVAELLLSIQSFPPCLPPVQSDARAEYAAWVIQQPSRTSLVIVLILSQASGMVKLVVNLIGFLALGLAPYAVAYYAPASYLPGGRQGGKEARTGSKKRSFALLGT